MYPLCFIAQVWAYQREWLIGWNELATPGANDKPCSSQDLQVSVSSYPSCSGYHTSIRVELWQLCTNSTWLSPWSSLQIHSQLNFFFCLFPPENLDNSTAYSIDNRKQGIINAIQKSLLEKHKRKQNNNKNPSKLWFLGIWHCVCSLVSKAGSKLENKLNELCTLSTVLWKLGKSATW